MKQPCKCVSFTSNTNCTRTCTNLHHDLTMEYCTPVQEMCAIFYKFSDCVSQELYRVGLKKPSPILFCLKCYCICLYGQNDTPHKLLVCSAHIDIKT